MLTAEVVPDVISKPPAEILEVFYPSGVKVKLGNELTPTQVKDVPKVTWSANSDTFFTLCLTDPDVPSREDPKFRECCHWLVVNVPSNKVSAGEVIFEYIGAGPSKGTGLHRYIFLVYKQPGKIECDEPKLDNRCGDGRANFKIENFAKKYNFERLFAGNFFQAQYDDYVPVLHKQLGL